MTFKEIDEHFTKNDMVRCLNDGIVRRLFRCIYVLSGDDECVAYAYAYDENDSRKPFVKILLYKNGEFAEIIEKGVDPYKEHIANVRNTCGRIGCTPTELLGMNYIKELGYVEDN